ncbi:MAG: DinB family protein [Williamsia sp.]|nr:DinB family protein [Williamsia sp.]
MYTLKSQLNITIDKWVDLVNKYSLNILLKKPSSESWSLGQVIMHIDTETNFYITQIETCLYSIENSHESMTDDAKTMFGQNSFPPVKIKRDDSLSQHYPQPESLDDLYSRMKILKKKLNSLVVKIETNNPKGKTRHPGLGYFNAKQWLQFSEMHMRHHLKQKDRIETELNLY